MNLIFQDKMCSPENISNNTEWRFPTYNNFYMDSSEGKEGYKSNPISVNSNSTLLAVINSNLLNSEVHSDIDNNIVVYKYKKDGTLIESSTMVREKKKSSIIDEQFDLFTTTTSAECSIITVWIKCQIISISMYEIT